MIGDFGPGTRGAERVAAPDTAAVFVISVAAQLSGLHPQTLRQYDRLGLVSPQRAAGRGRRYSARDIAALRTVQELTAAGINLAGVKRILELEGAVAALQDRIAELEAFGSAGSPRTVHREFPEPANPYLPVPVLRGSTALVLWRRSARRR